MKNRFFGIVGLLLLTGVSSSHAGDVSAGKTGFLQNCSGCHSINPVNNYYAPNLHCIVNRSAVIKEFPNYSSDFRHAAKDLVWTEELLLEYLQNQKRFFSEKLNAPDANIMMNVNIPDIELRKNILAYLISTCSE